MLFILPGTSLVPSGLQSHFTQVGKPTIPTAQRLHWLPRMLGLHTHWPVVSLHWVLYEPKVLQLQAVDETIKHQKKRMRLVPHLAVLPMF